MHAKRHVAHPAGRALARTHRQAFDLEHHLARRVRGRFRVELVQLAIHHLAHQPGPVHRGHRRVGHRAAVAQHGDAIGQLEQFLEPVRDIDDADLPRAQPGDQLEQQARLVMAQRGGGLVHDQDAGLAGHGLGDLHHLLLAHAELAHQPARVDRHADAGQQLARLAVHARAIDEAEAVERFAGEEDVLGDAQVVDHRQLLVDDADAQRARMMAVGQHHRAALDGDRAARVGLQHAGQDLHQGALAGAVLPGQRQHLAARDVQAHPGRARARRGRSSRSG